MKRRKILAFFATVILLTTLVACENLPNSASELSQTGMPDKAYRPSTDNGRDRGINESNMLENDVDFRDSTENIPIEEPFVAQNPLLPQPNVGQGLPSGAVPWSAPPKS